MHLWDTLNMNNFIKQHPKNSRNTSIYWYYSVFVCKRNMETNYVHVIYDWSSIQACKILVLFLFADQLVHCTMFVNPSISLISLPNWTCTLYSVCKSVHFFDISAKLNSLTSTRLLIAFCLIFCNNQPSCLFFVHSLHAQWFCKEWIIKKKSIDHVLNVY